MCANDEAIEALDTLESVERPYLGDNNIDVAALALEISPFLHKYHRVIVCGISAHFCQEDHCIEISVSMSHSLGADPT